MRCKCINIWCVSYNHPRMYKYSVIRVVASVRQAALDVAPRAGRLVGPSASVGASSGPAPDTTETAPSQKKKPLFVSLFVDLLIFHPT